MPKYKTQTNDLTEVIETGSGGSGGLTYESVNLGNIDTSTGTFDLMPEASKEKIINIILISIICKVFRILFVDVFINFHHSFC